MFCSKCGKENNEQSKFCENCGAQLGTMQKTSDKKKKKVPLVVILAVIVVLLIGVGGLGIKKTGLISQQTVSDKVTASDEVTEKVNSEETITTKSSEVQKTSEKENEKNSMEQKESNDEKMNEVIFEDPLVERCVRETLGKEDDEKITVVDCESIESLLIDCQCDFSFAWGYNTGKIEVGNYVDLCDLKYFTELQELYIDNSIDSDYLANLDAITNCKKLKKLHMEYNPSTYFINGEVARGYKYLADIVEQLPELEYLDLGYYVIDDFAEILKESNSTLIVNKNVFYASNYNVERLKDRGSNDKIIWKSVDDLEEYQNSWVYCYNGNTPDAEGDYIDKEGQVGLRIGSEEELRYLVEILPKDTEDILLYFTSEMKLNMEVFDKFESLKTLSIYSRYRSAMGLDSNTLKIANLEALYNHEGLFSVNFCGCNGDFSGLENIKGLKELSLVGCGIDKPEFLGEMTELRELTLVLCDNEDETLENCMEENYAKMKNLKYLKVSTTNSLSGIEHNKSLETVNIWFRGENDTLEHIGNCVELKKLIVCPSKSNSFDLADLNKLSKLEILYIENYNRLENIEDVLQLPNIVSINIPVVNSDDELNEEKAKELNTLINTASKCNCLSYFMPMESWFWGYVNGYIGKMDSGYALGQYTEADKDNFENSLLVKLLRSIDFEKLYQAKIYDGIVQSRMELNPTEPLSFEEAYEHYFFHYQGVSDIEEVGILGVWDSIDGEIRLIFESTGADFTVTNEGVEYANGTVQVINFATGKKDFAEYIIDGDSIILAHDLEKNRYAFSYENGAMIIHEDYFYKVDNTLVNQLIGTWKNDELEVEFKDVDDMHLRDKTGYRSNEGGTYAVLSEFSIWLISDSSEADILEYSVNGDTLNLNGTILHRDGGY